MKKSKKIFNQFSDLKSKIQKEALKNNDFNLFNQLSEISNLFLDYGCEKYGEALNRGAEIVKEAYKI